MKKPTFILASISVCILAACAVPVPPATTPPVTTGCTTFSAQAGLPQFSAFNVLSSDLAQMIGVQEYFLNRTTVGMASANTTVYNCTEMDIQLQFRARFAGDRGATEPPSAWKSVFLPPRGTASYGEVALYPATNRVSIDVADGNRGQQQFGQPQLIAPPVIPATPAIPIN